jgi:hypothetical protein
MEVEFRFNRSLLVILGAILRLRLSHPDFEDYGTEVIGVIDWLVGCLVWV